MPYTGSTAIYIGGSYGAWLKGALDDVKVYNRTLLASEVLADYQGITVPSDTTPPVRSNSQPIGTVTTSTTTLSLFTNEAAECRYSTSSSTGYDSMTSATTALGGLHSWSLTGLTNGARNYYVQCKDIAGNKNIYSYIISFTVSIP